MRTSTAASQGEVGAVEVAAPDSAMGAVLCYVDGPWAYFTTQELAKQTGDDWDDAPYEHNAEPPYEPCWHREGGEACDCKICERDWNPDGSPKWSIHIVGWRGPFETPDAWVTNSPWSVDQINAGATPWLKPAEFGAIEHNVSIPAGTTLAAFIELVESVGGTAYLPAMHPSVPIGGSAGPR